MNIVEQYVAICNKVAYRKIIITDPKFLHDYKGLMYRTKAFTKLYEYRNKERYLVGYADFYRKK